MTERVACQASTCLYRSGTVNQPIVWSSHNAFVKSKIKKKIKSELGLMVHACNLSTWETEAGRL
jgi:hypothetical protein